MMPQPPWREVCKTGAWFLFWFALLDMATTYLFRLPADPDQHPTTLQQYFSYGLSVESKIKRVLGDRPEQAAQIAAIGWPRTVRQQQADSRRLEPDSWRIVAYGQSFTQDVLTELQPMLPEATFAFIGGPAAPLNFAYARYLDDRASIRADVVILGIVAANVPAVTTLAHMTGNFEAPFPFTYPRYLWNGTSCDLIRPLVNGPDELRETLADPVRRQAWLAQLKTYDEDYSSLMFRESMLDWSTAGRLLRRAWGHHALRSRRARVHDAAGFREGCPAILETKWILSQFAAQARADGALPVVLLFNSRDYGDDLYRALQPTLDSQGIFFVSTHELASAANLQNFVPDGHFVPAANARFASALRDLIRRQMGSRSSGRGKPSVLSTMLIKGSPAA